MKDILNLNVSMLTPKNIFQFVVHTPLSKLFLDKMVVMRSQIIKCDSTHQKAPVGSEAQTWLFAIS